LTGALDVGWQRVRESTALGDFAGENFESATTPIQIQKFPALARVGHGRPRATGTLAARQAAVKTLFARLKVSYCCPCQVWKSKSMGYCIAQKRGIEILNLS
jgi:hypothetical protein